MVVEIYCEYGKYRRFWHLKSFEISRVNNGQNSFLARKSSCDFERFQQIFWNDLWSFLILAENEVKFNWEISVIFYSPKIFASKSFGKSPLYFPNPEKFLTKSLRKSIPFSHPKYVLKMCHFVDLWHTIFNKMSMKILNAFVNSAFVWFSRK